MVDGPDCRIERRAFLCEIRSIRRALKREEEGHRPFPEVRQISQAVVQRNYLQVKQDVQDIVQSEVERVLHDPALAHLVIRRETLTRHHPSP